jgi:hypothetical protein
VPITGTMVKGSEVRNKKRVILMGSNGAANEF